MSEGGNCIHYAFIQRLE